MTSLSESDEEPSFYSAILEAVVSPSNRWLDAGHGFISYLADDGTEVSAQADLYAVYYLKVTQGRACYNLDIASFLKHGRKRKWC